MRALLFLLCGAAAVRGAVVDVTLADFKQTVVTPGHDKVSSTFLARHSRQPRAATTSTRPAPSPPAPPHAHSHPAGRPPAARHRAQDVLILFFNDVTDMWKGLFARVAKEFPTSTVSFAQFDCTAQDPPPPFGDMLKKDGGGLRNKKDDAKGSTFPAVYFYRQGQAPERYKGSRTLVLLHKWIAAHPHMTHSEL